ncbi:hypothetical protein HU200_042809 [Digitaria exilis]|uniref:Uncharacterized protein n=1 Tax=Digitaria exilis TaxID=1010633 RepID=A0A835BBN8_9POAL|nr:hypothetical protein HU200_042809 [Digitaria exilis]
MVVRWRGCETLVGPEAQQPVILPPLEAGSGRCSVKPASRCACRIMDREAKLTHKPQRPTTNLERAGPAIVQLAQARSHAPASTPP